jgi:threonine/homoserine/homoserine lactone efflux protein
MDLAALVLFAGTLFVAAASPGPGIAALVARVIGRGSEGASAFAAGLILGDLIWPAVAILGLAVWRRRSMRYFWSSNMPAPPISFISPIGCG